MRMALQNAVQNFIDLLRGDRRQSIRAQLDQIDQLISQERWEQAIVASKEAADAAFRAHHFGLVSRAGRVLEQLGEFEDAAPIRFAAERRSYRSSLPLWDGERTAKSLLIDQVFDHLGQQLRHARLIAAAADRADRCVVLAERRLIPLLQRTFPNVEVVEQSEKRETERRASLVTNAWELAMIFANSTKAIMSGFIPLAPDQTLSASFRRSYSSEAQAPLVGFACVCRSVFLVGLVSALAEFLCGIFREVGRAFHRRKPRWICREGQECR